MQPSEYNASPDPIGAIADSSTSCVGTLWTFDGTVAALISPERVGERCDRLLTADAASLADDGGHVTSLLL